MTDVQEDRKNETIDKLLKEAEKGNREVFDKLLKEAERGSPEIVDKLVKILETGSLFDRFIAAYLLGETRSIRAMPALCRALTGPDDMPLLFLYRIRLLTSLGKEEEAKELGGLRYAALEALKKIGSKECIPDIIDAIIKWLGEKDANYARIMEAEALVYSWVGPSFGNELGKAFMKNDLKLLNELKNKAYERYGRVRVKGRMSPWCPKCFHIMKKEGDYLMCSKCIYKKKIV
ncbi:MAG: hypothetical protein KJ886_03535 [Candidatus Thermoplasmatota archaeon]|nr:hypothetical protein [Candidatus Thermoplasmatota archaeon]MBU4256497.1 hypothetical protein [Candidatus Thermoplasmatota archaeon]MCG2826475.1 hypothetical protein [Thermoplasmatales archaeon]